MVRVWSYISLYESVIGHGEIKYQLVKLTVQEKNTKIKPYLFHNQRTRALESESGQEYTVHYSVQKSAEWDGATLMRDMFDRSLHIKWNAI